MTCTVDVEHLIGAVVSVVVPAIAISTASLRVLESLDGYVDTVRWPGFFVVLLIALIVGAILGTVGAATNRVQTWDEFLLSVAC
jgi:hypothetical protein